MVTEIPFVLNNCIFHMKFGLKFEFPFLFFVFGKFGNLGLSSHGNENYFPVLETVATDSSLIPSFQRGFWRTSSERTKEEWLHCCRFPKRTCF